MAHSANHSIILTGWISAVAALAAGYRTIHRIYLQAGKIKPHHELVARQSRAAGIPITRLEQADLHQLAQNRSHGGVVAEAGPRRYQSLEELAVGAPIAFVAMLDGVEDPFNYGQSIRALYAAGAQGLVVRARTWADAETTVARASAGAAERIPTALVDSPLQAIQHFRQRGLRIACTGSGPTYCSIYEADLRQPLFLVIGGERRGIMRSLLQEADLQLSIPYGGDFQQALDITSATAILAFEVLRQRTAHRGQDRERSP